LSGKCEKEATFDDKILLFEVLKSEAQSMLSAKDFINYILSNDLEHKSRLFSCLEA